MKDHLVDAYLTGFMKAASARGLSELEAYALFKQAFIIDAVKGAGGGLKDGFDNIYGGFKDLTRGKIISGIGNVGKGIFQLSPTYLKYRAIKGALSPIWRRIHKPTKPVGTSQEVKPAPNTVNPAPAPANTAPPPPAPTPVQPVPSANQALPPPSVQNIGQGGPPAPIAQNVNINNEIAARDLNNSHLKEFRRRHGTAFDPNSTMDRNKMEYIVGAKVRPNYPLTPQGGNIDYTAAFRRMHGTPYDPNSRLDRAKMEALIAHLNTQGVGYQ